MQRHKHLMSLISDLFPNLFAKILQLYKLISISDFVEDAFARQCKQKNEFLFCIVLTYLYLCIQVRPIAVNSASYGLFPKSRVAV